MSYEEAHEEFQRNFLSAALTEAKGNMCAAARAIGLHRNTVLRMMHLLQMNLADYKTPLAAIDNAVTKSPRKTHFTEGCPDCGRKRFLPSAMGEGMVRCQKCYKLYKSAGSAADESERAA